MPLVDDGSELPVPWRSRQSHVAHQAGPAAENRMVSVTSQRHSATADNAKLAQKMGLIRQIPTGIYDGSKKARECAICVAEFEVGEMLSYLPCAHIYHKDCIEDWLLRSLTCPSCMEPVDAALFSSFGAAY